MLYVTFQLSKEDELEELSSECRKVGTATQHNITTDPLPQKTVDIWVAFHTLSCHLHFKSIQQ